MSALPSTIPLQRTVRLGSQWVNLAVLLIFDIDLFAAMQLSDSLLQTIRANREPQVCDYEESELKGAHGCYSLMFDTLNLHC